jgi:hypothetical protein
MDDIKYHSPRDPDSRTSTKLRGLVDEDDVTSSGDEQHSPRNLNSEFRDLSTIPQTSYQRCASKRSRKLASSCATFIHSLIPHSIRFFSLRLKFFLVVEGGWRPWDHVLQYFVLFLIIANVIMFIVSTLPDVRRAAEIPMDYIEAFCIYVFMLEFALRLWVCVEKPRFKRSGPILGRFLFLLTFSSIVDLVSIVPFWIDWGLRLGTGDSHLPGRRVAQFSSALRVFRIFRILKAEKYTKAFRVLVKVLKSKRDVLFVSAMMWIFLLLCTSTALYYVQAGVDPNEFGSIPASFYGAILLLTGQGFWCANFASTTAYLSFVLIRCISSNLGLMFQQR